MNKLREEILEAQRIDPKPRNETETREMIIRPLIEHLGYKRSEIRSEAPDPSGKIPDFTIMPETDFTWFLEAKDWRNKLSDVNATQAINYAHAMGRRWVVLTNGKEWRLYDDAIAGVSSDRLVVTIQINDTEELCELLTSLSKESITSDEISKYAVKQRLNSTLSTDLMNENSAIVKNITKLMKESLKDVTCQLVANYFKDNLKEKSAVQGLYTNKSTYENKAKIILNSSVTENSTNNQTDGWFSLKDANENPKIGKGKKPVQFKIPDSREVTVETWVKVFIAFFDYILIHEGSRFKSIIDRYSSIIVIDSPESVNTFKSSEILTIKNERYRIKTWSSTEEKLKFMVNIALAMNLPLEGFQFKLQE